MSKKLKPCTVEQDGPLWRVVEANGSKPAGVSNHSDGGGFANKRDAEHLAATINERRKAKANG